MVPLHLRLYNFLSYQGDTELDLRGIHVGCLSGDNGNGKSALLDAVTWALWGWARGRRYGTGGASPDELVYQGQTDMEVALTFAAGEATYRIVRKHSKGGGRRGAARMVDLQAATGDGYRSLTEGSVAETEAQVQRLLRMSYDTFVNSAFMLQGEADRFTTSKPASARRPSPTSSASRCTSGCKTAPRSVSASSTRSCSGISWTAKPRSGSWPIDRASSSRWTTLGGCWKGWRHS